ncbi:MAG TPA: hypothetical protein VGS16_15215 [Candidatus Dormibacteraeota bacterium]|nr:hypothetical protein [Candidatus Dormibacteraeota bacterium]
MLAGAALLLGSEMWPPATLPAPLVGFSYSPLMLYGTQRDPAQDLQILLNATKPDLVRLPVYWELVEPAADSLDFSSVDELLAVVEDHNQVAARPTRVVLTVGARNFLYPELHAPQWAGPREQPYLNDAQSGSAYRAYFDGTIIRYRSSPLLYAWQVENEPFDYVVNDLTGADQITPEQVAWEIARAHELDQAHEVATTTFDAWNASLDMLQVYAPPALAALGISTSGHPSQALAAADALGLDLYVDAPSTPVRFTSMELRASWKQQAIDFWAGQARAQGKDLWLAEMEAQPWRKTSSFTTADLLTTALDYRQEPLQVVLLWGVDTWLEDPAWMAAATHAMAILRS